MRESRVACSRIHIHFLACILADVVSSPTAPAAPGVEALCIEALQPRWPSFVQVLDSSRLCDIECADLEYEGTYDLRMKTDLLVLLFVIEGSLSISTVSACTWCMM